MPSFSRSRAAASLSAVIRCADLIEATTTNGASVGADARRAIRSVDRRLSQRDRYRREDTLMMIPLDDPPAGRTAPVLDERQFKARAAKTAVVVGLARSGRDPPAGGG